MKKLVSGAIGAFLAFALAYVATAFIVFDLSPANWSVNARAALAVVGGLLSFIFAVIAAEMGEGM